MLPPKFGTNIVFKGTSELQIKKVIKHTLQIFEEKIFFMKSKIYLSSKKLNSLILLLVDINSSIKSFLFLFLFIQSLQILFRGKFINFSISL